MLPHRYINRGEPGRGGAVRCISRERKMNAKGFIPDLAGGRFPPCDCVQIFVQWRFCMAAALLRTVCLSAYVCLPQVALERAVTNGTDETVTGLAIPLL